MNKVKVLSFVGVLYLVFIYSFFWVKTDDVTKIQRLNHYTGTVESIDCYTIKKSRGSPEHRLRMIFDTGELLDLRFPGKTCKYFHRKIPTPKGRNFEAFLMASLTMKIKVGDKVLIHFKDEKKRVNAFTVGFGIFPFALFFLGQYMKRKGEKSRGQPA